MTKTTKSPFHVMAFLGPAGAGKSTAANMLCDYAFVRGGHDWRVLSFARPLKEILWDQNPIITEDYDLRLLDAIERYGESQVKKAFPEYRRLLQDTGEAIKEHDPTFFVNAMRREIGKATHDHSGVVIDDLRFPAELDGLLDLPSLGFSITTIRVRPIEELPLEGAHISERAMADYEVDHTVQAGGLDDLGRQLFDIYKTITEGSHGV